MELITLIPIPDWTSPVPPRSLLTFILLHTDGGVGEDTGISLQVVVVGAVIILILEGAVLTTLLCGERGHSCEVMRARKGEQYTHTEQGTQETPQSAPSSASHVTFLQLLHHLDLELARAAVPFQVACPPGLAADTVPDALTHSLEALGRGGGDSQGGREDTALKGRAGEAAPRPRVRARSRSKREITNEGFISPVDSKLSYTNSLHLGSN